LRSTSPSKLLHHRLAGNQSHGTRAAAAGEPKPVTKSYPVTERSSGSGPLLPLVMSRKNLGLMLGANPTTWGFGLTLDPVPARR